MAPKKNARSPSPLPPAAAPAATSTGTSTGTSVAPTTTTTTPQSSTPSQAPPTTQSSSASTSTSTSASTKAQIPSSLRSAQDFQQIAQALWQNYVDQTPARTKQLDAFQAFLVAVGLLQFVYCVLGGNYPFNAFLSGFSATVGQFVLTASLRMQTNARNEGEFKGISHERAFADYVFGSVILHFFCINFIN